MKVYLQVERSSTSGSEGTVSTLIHCWELPNQNFFRSQGNKLTSKISVVTTNKAVNVTTEFENVCGVATFRDRGSCFCCHLWMIWCCKWVAGDIWKIPAALLSESLKGQSIKLPPQLQRMQSDAWRRQNLSSYYLLRVFLILDPWWCDLQIVPKRRQEISTTRCVTPKNGTDRLSRNVGNKSPLLAS